MAVSPAPTPTRPPRRRNPNTVVSRVLRSRAHRLLSGTVLLLTYTGRRSGLRRELPVQYARDGDRWVVVAGSPHRKTWWRNFTAPAPVVVTLAGELLAGTAVLLPTGSAARNRALTAYRRRFRGARIDDGTPVVLISSEPPPSEGAR